MDKTIAPINLDKFEIKHYLRHIDDQELDTDEDDGEAMSSTTTFSTRWRLTSIFIHFDDECSQTLTITFSSKDGADYNTIISIQVLVGATDVFYQGEETDNYWKGDEITVSITADSGAPHAYLTILGREIA